MVSYTTINGVQTVNGTRRRQSTFGESGVGVGLECPLPVRCSWGSRVLGRCGVGGEGETRVESGCNSGSRRDVVQNGGANTSQYTKCGL